MKLVKTIKKLPLLIQLIIIAMLIYTAYNLIIILSKLFVFFGFNLFVYLDNLLKFSDANPIMMWGILGLFFGSIIGVVIAVKKYKLPKKLIFYPIGITTLLMVTLSFVNKPTNLSGSFRFPNEIQQTPAEVPQTAVLFYTATQEMNARFKPSLYSQKIFVLPKGGQVLIIENVSDWSKVQYTNPVTGYKQFGYVKTKFLTASR